MSDDVSSTTTPDGSPLASGPRERMALQWGVVLAGGVAAFLLGLALAAWPDETVKVLAFLLAFQLIVTGVAQIFVGLASGKGARRWAIVFGGLVSLGVGVLFLFDPLQTLTFIGWIVGICVIAVGVADLFGAFLTPSPRHRTWQVVRGLLGVVIGLFFVINPDKSLGALVVIAIVWLVGYGFITIIAAFALRSEQRRSAA